MSSAKAGRVSAKSQTISIKITRFFADNESEAVCSEMRKKIIFLTMFFLLCASMFAQAGLRIILQESAGNLIIVGSHGNVRELVIPETVNDMPITAIGERAFAGRGLALVSIPDSVIEIGEGAFSNNDLSTLVIGNSVETIGLSAFSNNRLNNLTLGTSVRYIGMGAFSSNHLVTLEIPDSVVDIGPYAFFYNRLTNVSIPDSVITIGEGAFSSNRIHSVIIGGSVQAIGDGAFFNNRITAITIPPSVTALGNRVFESRLTRVGGAPPIYFLDETGELLFTTGTNFDAFFTTTGRRAGSYTFSRDGWVFEE